MTVRELKEKLAGLDDVYLDSQVEKAVPVLNDGRDFVSEEITRMFTTEPILSDGKPIPDRYRKVILL